jgi:hypothetical protein
MSDSNRTGPLGGRSGGPDNHDHHRCGADGNRSGGAAEHSYDHDHCGPGSGIGFECGPGRKPDGRR